MIYSAVKSESWSQSQSDTSMYLHLQIHYQGDAQLVQMFLQYAIDPWQYVNNVPGHFWALAFSFCKFISEQ